MYYYGSRSHARRPRRNPAQEVSLSVRHGSDEPARAADSSSPVNPRTMIGAILVLAGAAGLIWQFRRPTT